MLVLLGQDDCRVSTRRCQRPNILAVLYGLVLFLGSFCVDTTINRSGHAEDVNHNPMQYSEELKQLPEVPFRVVACEIMCPVK